MVAANSTENELRLALRACKQHFIFAAIFSSAVNILLLTPIIYMMTVFDRVIASGSLPTLAMLSLLMVSLLLAMGGFEWVRSLILISASNRLDLSLRRRISDATFQRSLLSGGMAPDTQPAQDLTGIRQFLTGNGLFAFFDAPWFPIYVGLMFMFHPLFGVAGVLSGIVMLGLAIVNERSTAKLLTEANTAQARAMARFQGSLRNAEVVAAMGMGANVLHRQDTLNNEVMKKITTASKKGGMLSSLSKSIRMISQSSLLGLGAYLALIQEISPGMMIGGSLLLGRALAPIDMLVGSWKGVTLARAQYARLEELLLNIPARKETMSLPSPVGELTVENATVVPPGARNAVVVGVSFSLAPGEFLGIVGPSASGKSSLARAVLGIWPVYAGAVRLDGANISSWDRQALGPHIGYLPQDIELFDGTIAENICRFGEPDADKIVTSAKTAGVHDMILRLPNGYDTVIGGAGGILSGGQRQRLGLARAIYDRPKLLLLDEPNSNLDEKGERDLVEALNRLRANACTVIIITHRTMVLQCVDKILVMKEGVTASYGSKDQVLANLTRQAPKSQIAAN